VNATRRYRAVGWLVAFGLVRSFVAAATPTPMPSLHVTFSPGGNSSDVVATEQVRGAQLEVRRAVRVVPLHRGWAAEFAGHPEQAVVLGPLDLRPPVTLVLWVKRARSPSLFAAASSRPEYTQEHAVGAGRILSPMTGQPREAGNLSGILRLEADGLAVWHGLTKWHRVIARPLPTEQWLHLAVTIETDLTATGYLDGLRAGAALCGFDFGTGPVALVASALRKGYGYPFAGAIGDVRFYRCVLSESEIRTLATTRADP
jgi:hypothetical protein